MPYKPHSEIIRFPAFVHRCSGCEEQIIGGEANVDDNVREWVEKHKYSRRHYAWEKEEIKKICDHSHGVNKIMVQFCPELFRHTCKICFKDLGIYDKEGERHEFRITKDIQR